MKEIHLGLKQLKPIQFLPLSSGAQLSRCAGSLANLRGAYLAKATDGFGSVGGCVAPKRWISPSKWEEMGI